MKYLQKTHHYNRLVSESYYKQKLEEEEEFRKEMKSRLMKAKFKQYTIIVSILFFFIVLPMIMVS